MNTKPCHNFDFYRSPGLDDPVGRELLLKLAPHLINAPVEELFSLLRSLENNPNAITLAGHYLANFPGQSLSIYRSKLEEEKRCINGSGSIAIKTKIHWTLPITWIVFASSWKQLKYVEAGDTAQRVFRIIGFCAPEIPFDTQLITDVLTIDNLACEKALVTLIKFGLLENTENGPIITRELSEYARNVDQQEHENLLSDLIETWKNYLSISNAENHSPLDYTIQNHIKATAQIGELYQLNDIGLLWYKLARQKISEGDLHLAKEYFQRALQNDQATYGASHIKIAICSTHLGYIAQMLNESTTAIEHYQRALDIYTNVLEPDNPLISTVMTRLQGLQ